MSSAIDPEPYEAIVYDLDGTLVRLAVDWAAVERELVELCQDNGVDPSNRDTWSMLDVAEDAGFFEAAHRIVARHEEAGVAESRRLQPADRLPESVPTGLCSLNCEAACRGALARHGIADHLVSDAVVGRDTVSARKPDPTPLLAAVDALGVAPGDVLFIGDSPGDETTASRAGTAFAYVDPPWDDVGAGLFRDAESESGS